MSLTKTDEFKIALIGSASDFYTEQNTCEFLKEANPANK
jgi:hypothetical protein